MNSNPQLYTFSIQTLSQSQYKYFLKDCLYDILYTQGILNQVDESLNSDRIDIVNNFKVPLFKSVEILK